MSGCSTSEGVGADDLAGAEEVNTVLAGLAAVVGLIESDLPEADGDELFEAGSVDAADVRCGDASLASFAFDRVDPEPRVDRAGEEPGEEADFSESVVLRDRESCSVRRC